MDTGENFGSGTKHIFLGLRRTVLVPGVCLCICICAMMHYVHTGEAVVTSIKFDIFLLVTTRAIAHSGRFVYIPIVLVSLTWTLGSPW